MRVQIPISPAPSPRKHKLIIAFIIFLLALTYDFGYKVRFCNDLKH
jgi:hypothetical protein